jgi:hypothetical protein
MSNLILAICVVNNQKNKPREVLPPEAGDENKGLTTSYDDCIIEAIDITSLLALPASREGLFRLRAYSQ